MAKVKLEPNEEVLGQFTDCLICEMKQKLFSDDVKLIPNGSTHTLLVTGTRLIFVPNSGGKTFFTIMEKALGALTGASMPKKAFNTFLRNEGIDIYGTLEMPIKQICSAIVGDEKIRVNNSDYFGLSVGFSRARVKDFKNFPSPSALFLFNTMQEPERLMDLMGGRAHFEKLERLIDETFK